MKIKLNQYPSGKSDRKVSVEIENFDTWALDHSLAMIIYPALLQLRDTKSGVPSEFTNRIGGDFDDNYYFDFINEDDTEVFNQLCDNWTETLDKMIWSFYQLSLDDDYDNKYHHGEMEISWEKLPDELSANFIDGPRYHMVDKNPSGHWYDKVGHTEHENRIQEGLDLFGKHFRSLWD